jgi:hypothetical protein
MQNQVGEFMGQRIPVAISGHLRVHEDERRQPREAETESIEQVSLETYLYHERTRIFDELCYALNRPPRPARRDRDLPNLRA